jgi:hypothetical protein
MKFNIKTRKSKKKAAIHALATWLIADMKLARFKAEFSIILTKEALNLGACHEIIPGTMYAIVLDSSQGLASTLQTLCHEFVHLKQFLTGKLGYNGEGGVIWCGMVFCPKKTDYYCQPWEIQAFKEEILLFRRATAHFENLQQ